MSAPGVISSLIFNDRGKTTPRTSHSTLEGDDCLLTTTGSALDRDTLHKEQGESDEGRTTRRIVAVCSFLLASLGSAETNAQAVPYDNTEPGPIKGPRPTSPADVAAQQFLTGDFDNVSSVTLALQRVDDFAVKSSSIG